MLSGRVGYSILDSEPSHEEKRMRSLFTLQPRGGLFYVRQLQFSDPLPRVRVEIIQK
jgi:hypothetical protein